MLCIEYSDSVWCAVPLWTSKSIEIHIHRDTHAAALVYALTVCVCVSVCTWNERWQRSQKSWISVAFREWVDFLHFASTLRFVCYVCRRRCCCGRRHRCRQSLLLCAYRVGDFLFILFFFFTFCSGVWIARALADVACVMLSMEPTKKFHNHTKMCSSMWNVSNSNSDSSSNSKRER